ncbi:glycosyltransferase family 2 protein [Sphingobacterium sp. lm-10]|uniref:glycosyltransferase family 2 protein n=1 Tax=Sphingobacterium sp. lm-10 TaxID=2944904 RepID=UPI002022412F|nr:glycosyltransferase family A protein [Sphingobacterium sp. lm-10]MCL7988408.1 glycosyltransferase family 2 protein [Sphingobacterium sp. lm-10]
MNKILISIIVPCYNQSDYLNECLQSVYQQSYTNWECIIVDDGSPDDTENVAKAWTELDHRFRYIKKENAGVASARNLGIIQSSGDWILPLDADDKIGVRYIELACPFFNSDYKIIYCNAEYFGSIVGKWELPEFSIERLAIGNIIFCSAFFRRSDFNNTFGYDENILYGYEDWEFWITLIKDGGCAIKMKEVNFYYRKKDMSRQVALDSSKEKKLSMLKYIHNKHRDFFLEHIDYLHDLANEGLEFAKVRTSKSYKIGLALAKLKTTIIPKWLFSR